MLVVIDLDRRVDAQGDRHLFVFPDGAVDHSFKVLSRLLAILQAQQVERLTCRRDRSEPRSFLP